MTQQIHAYDRAITPEEAKNEIPLEVYTAAKENDKEGIRRGLSKSDYANNLFTTKTGTKTTLALVNAKHDDPEALKMILDAANGLALSQADSGGNTLLHVCAATGAEKNTKFILSKENLQYGGLDINAVNWMHKTPLLVAIENEQISVACELLNAGADPNISEGKTFTPLHLAAASEYTNLVKALLTAGANPNSPDPTNTTPLHTAVCQGNTENVKTLLDAGSNVSIISDLDGKTPLQAAIHSGNAETIEVMGKHIAALYAGDPSVGGTRDILQEFDCKGYHFRCYVENGKRYIEVGNRKKGKSGKPTRWEKLLRSEFDSVHKITDFSPLGGDPKIDPRSLQTKFFKSSYLPAAVFAQYEEMKRATEDFLGTSFHFEMLTPVDGVRNIFCKLTADPSNPQ